MSDDDDDDREATAICDADDVFDDIDEDDDDDGDGSVDSCEAYINFVSIRDARSQLEEGISFGWPGVYDDDDDDVDCDNDERRMRRPRKIVLSTLLEERDFAPLFDGASWAGTRLWPAAIRAVQYLSGILPSTTTSSTSLTTTTTSMVEEDDEFVHRCDGDDIIGIMEKARTSPTTSTSVLELGCGLGVPGMILHLLGCDVVLTDQEDILSQLEKNVSRNFHDARTTSLRRISTETSATLTTTTTTTEVDDDENDGDDCVINNIDDDDPRRHSQRRRKRGSRATICAMPLSWSRDGMSRLLEDLNRVNIGFDVVLNCDCVYEPLYGKR